MVTVLSNLVKDVLDFKGDFVTDTAVEVNDKGGDVCRLAAVTADSPGINDCADDDDDAAVDDNGGTGSRYPSAGMFGHNTFGTVGGS